MLSNGMPANGQMIPQGDERKLIVRFYLEPQKNNTKSLAEGRPIFDEKLMVEILAPGDRNSRVNRPARDEDKERFPYAWNKFQTNATPANVGTPLEEWPSLTVTEVAEFKAMNLYTVEQVAGMHDGITSKYSGFHTYRKMAQAYIEAAKGPAEAQRLAVELERRDDEIARLNARIDELGALFERDKQAQVPQAKQGKPMKVAGEAA